MKKKILLVGLLVVLVAAVSVGLTVAFLTSQSAVTNTFTVGDVAITLDEAKVDENGVKIEGANRVTENRYKLIPGHSYTKDPQIHVGASSEDCYLFVKVEDGLAAIEDNQTIAAQMADNNWKAVSGVENVYVYAVGSDAKTIVTKGVDVDVFGSFTLKGDANTAAYENAQIVVTAYAIQADGFANSTPAQIWETAGFAN